MRMLPSGDVLPIAKKPHDATRSTAMGLDTDAAVSAKSFGGLRRVRRAHSVMEGFPGVIRRDSSLTRSWLDSPAPSLTSFGRSPSVLMHGSSG